jgi:hypothetical protein
MHYDTEKIPLQVRAICKMAGGPWFVSLALRDKRVELGPYENPALAREDATKLREFLGAVIRVEID